MLQYVGGLRPDVMILSEGINPELEDRAVVASRTGTVTFIIDITDTLVLTTVECYGRLTVEGSNPKTVLLIIIMMN